jgi:hypothetical protein
MGKVCAYCGNTGKFTREHVWPNCFLERLECTHAHFSPKSGKVHGGDYVVCDVCTTCNSDKLSELDDYFCYLYDKYFVEPRGVDEEVIFEYEYDPLARALLKISYNTARSAGSEITPFKYLTDYMLDGESRPFGFVIIGELVSPTFIAEKKGTKSVVKEIRPTMYRSMRGQLQTPHGSTVLTRIVAISSFFFHILIARDPKNEDVFNTAVHEFLSVIDGTELLNPVSTSITLRTTHRDSLSSMMPLLKLKHKEYKEFFESYKK